MEKLIKCYIETEDTYWACAFAAALRSAKLKPTGTNPRFSAGFIPTNAVTKLLSQEFDRVTVEYVEAVIPKTEEEFRRLDRLESRKVRKELEVLHGIPSDPNAPSPPVPIKHLASTILFFTFGLISEAGFWYPEVKPIPLDGIDFLVETEESIEQAKVFLAGAGKPNSKYLVLEGRELSEQIQLVANHLPLVLGNKSQLLPIVSSYSGTWENHVKPFPTLIRIDPSVEPDSRYSHVFFSQIPLLVNEPLEQLEHKGRGWKFKEECDFDHHEFERRRAAGYYV